MRWHRDQSTKSRVLPALAALAFLLLGTMAAIAAQDGDNAKSSDKAAPKVNDLRVNVAGMQVSIDPATGRLRPPTLEESRALARALHQQFVTPSQPLQVIQAANGALAVELPEETMETVLLRTRPDGTYSIDCMSAAEAARLLEEESSMATPQRQSDLKRAVPARLGTSPSLDEKE